MTRFGDPASLDLLWLLVPAAGLLLWAWWRRRVATKRLADPALLARIAPYRLKLRRLASALLTLGAIASIAFALARPQGAAEEQTATASGRDIVFVVDVSRSMLATDLAPNRLERCKLWIKDMVSSLQGDRVGLVAFAGSATVKCPLTLDGAFFEMALEDLSPASVSRGGSMIGDALRKAVNEVFAEESGRHRDILLFTDGEDQDSFPTQAAELAAQKGIRIIAIGVGSEGSGSPVPAGKDRPGPDFVTYQGHRVMSRLNADALTEIATTSAGGVFLNVGTGTLQLDRVYADLSKNLPRAELVVDRTTTYEELFQTPLLIAFVLLCVEGLIRER